MYAFFLSIVSVFIFRKAVAKCVRRLLKQKTKSDFFFWGQHEEYFGALWRIAKDRLDNDLLDINM